MLIYKTYLFRMYPNSFQKNKIDTFFMASNFIYNYYLNKKLNNNNLSFIEMQKDFVNLKQKELWLKNIDKFIFKTTLQDLEKAFKSYYSGLTQKPKYKDKNFKRSYRTIAFKSSDGYKNIDVDLKNRFVKLPMLNKIPIKGYRNKKDFNARIISATVKENANKYYVMLLVAENVEDKKFLPNYIVGIDLGIKNLITTSNGVKYARLNAIECYEKKLQTLLKILNKKQINSNNRLKLVKKIERIHQKIHNMRKFYIHSITNDLIKSNDIIIIESLKVKEMLHQAKGKFAKHLADVSLSECIRQLEYKSKWHNKKVYKINTYYPSSQICSNCKTKNIKLKDLNVREWECQNCNYFHDRDINASINILDEG